MLHQVATADLLVVLRAALDPLRPCQQGQARVSERIALADGGQEQRAARIGLHQPGMH